MLIHEDSIPSDLREFFEPAACGKCWTCNLVAVMREARRVLRMDGVCWIEVGDTYAGGSTTSEPRPGSGRADGIVDDRAQRNRNGVGAVSGVKPKDLVGAPWMLAFALRADGWYLRSDTIWSRPNPMPESVTDRPTKAHSYVFLLTKSARYYYDADAIREAAEYGFRDGGFRGGGTKYVGQQRGTSNHDGEKAGTVSGGDGTGGRNARSVWSIPTEPTPFAHFATFPQALVERCIKAGTSERGACSECGAPWRRITERDSSAPIPTKMSTQRAPMDAEAIAAYLRSHRESAGLSRADVDRALGTVTLYSWFEGRPAGIEVPTVEQWAKLKPILRLGDEFDDAVAATVEVEVTDASGGAETGDAHVRRYAKAWNSAPKFLRWEPSCRCCVAVADWIVKPCVVLDPFMGSGTTALVARRLGRHAVGCELNLEYLEISARRLEQLSLLA